MDQPEARGTTSSTRRPWHQVLLSKLTSHASQTPGFSDVAPKKPGADARNAGRRSNDGSSRHRSRCPPCFLRSSCIQGSASSDNVNAAAAAGGSRTDASNSEALQACEAPVHLVVMVNGLWGSPANWNCLCSALQKQLKDQDVLLHPSRVNVRLQTYHGIDKCGERLANEIRQVAQQHPSLKRISVIGHSMGGLLAR